MAEGRRSGPNPRQPLLGGVRERREAGRYAGGGKIKIKNDNILGTNNMTILNGTRNIFINSNNNINNVWSFK